MLVKLALSGCVLATMVFSGVTQARDLSKYVFPDVKHPADNKPTPERLALGKALFFDPRVSESNWISCATCHNPALGWSDGLPTAIGQDQKVLDRATPTILNTAYQSRQFWDGRERTLEDQAIGPIEAAGEMAQDLGSLLTELSSINGYPEMFEKSVPR